MTTLTARRPAATKQPAGPRLFNRSAYVKLIAAALPLPPETEADNERLTRIMFELDERGEAGQLSPAVARRLSTGLNLPVDALL